MNTIFNYGVYFVLIIYLSIICIGNMRTLIYENRDTLAILLGGILYRVALSVINSDFGMLGNGFLGMFILSIPIFILAYYDYTGGGDLKLMAGVGMVLGFKISLIILIITSVYCIGYLLIIKVKNRERVYSTGLLWLCNTLASIGLSFFV